MAENLLIHTGNKEEKYRELLPQLQALVSSETNRIANLYFQVDTFMHTTATGTIFGSDTRHRVNRKDK